jgi:hypothetical protein
MQKDSCGDDFRIVFNALQLCHPRCEEPGTDDVIEQIGLAFQAGMFDRPIND